jgi:hypothetical protein
LPSAKKFGHPHAPCVQLRHEVPFLTLRKPRKWPKTAQTGPKWPKMAKIGSWRRGVERRGRAGKRLFDYVPQEGFGYFQRIHPRMVDHPSGHTVTVGFTTPLPKSSPLPCVVSGIGIAPAEMPQGENRKRRVCRFSQVPPVDIAHRAHMRTFTEFNGTTSGTEAGNPPERGADRVAIVHRASRIVHRPRAENIA